ncbi:TetR/AcrR family transcriptional regulator [Nitratireductor aestuarii]|nr:TetR/AcrR family transcriptional regulator [Nitratireductor aestuarii]
MADRSEKHRNLTREDWIRVARLFLVDAGVASVKIEALAQAIGATRGSFYWHFADHAALLDALLDQWEHINTEPFRRAFANAEGSPQEQLLRFALVWLGEEFDPNFDSAVRDWGRNSPNVAEAVRRVDDERIDMLYSLFCRAGYDETESLVRARTLYYHQVGYFALKISQTREERLKLLPVYFRVLTGFPIPPNTAEIIRQFPDSNPGDNAACKARNGGR